jgi:hypothetical protein
MRVERGHTITKATSRALYPRSGNIWFKDIARVAQVLIQGRATWLLLDHTPQTELADHLEQRDDT